MRTCSRSSEGWDFTCPKCGNTETYGNKFLQRVPEKCEACGKAGPKDFEGCTAFRVKIAKESREFCVIEFSCEGCGHSTATREERVDVSCGVCKTEFAYAHKPNKDPNCPKRSLNKRPK